MHKVVEITTSEVLNRLLQAGIKNVKLGTDIMPCESEARVGEAMYKQLFHFYNMLGGSCTQFCDHNSHN